MLLTTYEKSKLEKLAHVLFPPISKEIGISYKIGYYRHS